MYFKGWIDTTPHVDLDGQVVLCKLCLSTSSLYFSIRISSDFSWTLLLLGQHIQSTSCPFLQQLPEVLDTVANVGAVISALDSSSICIGNNDTKFFDLLKSRKGAFKDQHGMI